MYNNIEELKAACGARAQSLGMGAYIFGPDLDTARRVLEEKGAEWGVGRIFGDQELRALHAPGDVHLAVDALPGHCFIDRPGKTYGEHGFSLDCPQARTLWYLAGPGVKKGVTLPEENLVNIAPTLAQLMGLSLPEAQGRAVREAFA